MNFDSDVMSMLNKCICVKLCPAVLGQVMVGCVMNPPMEGEPSYDLYMKVCRLCVLLYLSTLYASADH